MGSGSLVNGDSSGVKHVKAVVLLSGGIDSSTTLAIARDQGYECYTMTILYGQTHKKEVISARAVSTSQGVTEHRVIELPRGMFSGSALTGEMKIPLNRDIGTAHDIPDTYVPARNLVFLSIASSWAEVLGADAVFIGVTALDYSGYPDCRPEFIHSFKNTVNLATRIGVEGNGLEIRTPLIDLKKNEIILKGKELGLDLSLTWSCYSGRDKACGKCDSCLYRLKGFKEAGLEDPIQYE